MPRPRGRGYHERMNHPRRTLLAVLSGCLLGVAARGRRLLVLGPQPPGRGPARGGCAPARGGHRPHQGRLRGQHGPPRADVEGDPRHGRRTRPAFGVHGRRRVRGPAHRHRGQLFRHRRRGRAAMPASSSWSRRSTARPPRARASARATRSSASRAARSRTWNCPRRSRKSAASPGTIVNLTLAREAARPFDVAVERAIVSVHSVRFEVIEPGYGYLRISQFSETTGPDIDNALRSLVEQAGGRLRGLVLDLRNNPGGVLDAAVSRVGCLPRERRSSSRPRGARRNRASAWMRRPAT